MTWCWTRAAICRFVSQRMLISVSTCQGGVTTNNCYSHIVMFACAFYNVFGAINSHSVIHRSTFVSFESNRNFTTDFGSVTFLINSFVNIWIYGISILHGSVEIIGKWVSLEGSSKDHLIQSSRKKEGPLVLTWEHFLTSLKNLGWILSENGQFWKLSIFLMLTSCFSMLCCSIRFHTESQCTDWNPSGKWTVLGWKISHERNFWYLWRCKRLS